MAFSLSELAQRVGGEALGQCPPLVGPNALADARPDQVALLNHARYLPDARDSTAGCILTNPELSAELRKEDREGLCMLVVANPDAAWSKVLAAFAPAPWRPAAGVHPAACVHPQAKLGPGCAIGPGAVIGQATLGAGCIVHANVCIGDDAVLGEHCELWPGVVVRERCTLGARCIVHPNTVIGADGFGYTFVQGRHEKVPHIGTVQIGDDVEIGACTTIDRAKFGATVIGSGTKIDNQVQVAHNCRIGRNVVIVAQVGLAGSVTLGDYAVLAGKVGVGDHLTVGPGAKLGACCAVMDDIPAQAEVIGQPAQDGRTYFKQLAGMRRLPELLKQVRDLERRVNQLEQPGHH